MKIYRLNKSGFNGTPKWGNKPMNFARFIDTHINYKIFDEDENEVDSNKSMITFRFHSSKAFCQMSQKNHIDTHGGVHVRYFIYDGIDKTEEELIDWVLTNETLLANDNKTTMYGATEL